MKKILTALCLMALTACSALGIGLSANGNNTIVSDQGNPFSTLNYSGNLVVGSGGQIYIAPGATITAASGSTVNGFGGGGGGGNVSANNILNFSLPAPTNITWALGNLTIGNIVSVNLNGSSSQVLYGNGTFANQTGGGTTPFNISNVTLNGFFVGNGTNVGTVLAPVNGSLVGWNGTGTATNITISTGLTLTGNVLTASGGGGGGTVTNTTISSLPTWLTGSFANSTTVPALTLAANSTTVAGFGITNGGNLDTIAAAANPVIQISNSTWAGDSSISTVGTITSGTMNGTIGNATLASNAVIGGSATFSGVITMNGTKTVVAAGNSSQAGLQIGSSNYGFSSLSNQIGIIINGGFDASITAAGWQGPVGIAYGQTLSAANGTATLFPSNGTVSMAIDGSTLAGASIAIGVAGGNANISASTETGALLISAGGTVSTNGGPSGGGETGVGNQMTLAGWRNSGFGCSIVLHGLSSTLDGYGGYGDTVHAGGFGRGARLIYDDAFTLGANEYTSYFGGEMGVYYDMPQISNSTLVNQVGTSVTVEGVPGLDGTCEIEFRDSQSNPGYDAIGIGYVSGGVLQSVVMLKQGTGYSSTGNISAVFDFPYTTVPTFTYTLGGSGQITAVTVATGGTGLTNTTLNNAGGQLNIAGGASTGTALPGNVNIQLSLPAASASGAAANVVNGMDNIITAYAVNSTLGGVLVNGTSNITGAATFGGTINGVTVGVGNISGTATNDNGAAGRIGEYASATLASGSAVSLTTATTSNVTSVSLTAGDWDVTGVVDFVQSGVTATNFQSGISTTSATLPAQDNFVQVPLNNGLASITATYSQQCPIVRVSLSTTTTVYLVANVSFSVGTTTAYGTIRARRVR